MKQRVLIAVVVCTVFSAAYAEDRQRIVSYADARFANSNVPVVASTGNPLPKGTLMIPRGGESLVAEWRSDEISSTSPAQIRFAAKTFCLSVYRGTQLDSLETGGAGLSFDEMKEITLSSVVRVRVLRCTLVREAMGRMTMFVEYRNTDQHE